MEEKERYEWNSRFDEAIKDNQTGDIVNAVEVLNQQDKRIKELEDLVIEYKNKLFLIKENSMSNEYEFLKKQRYEYYKDTNKIVDNELDDFVDDVVERLNTQYFNKLELLKVKQIQDQRIAELEEQLKKSLKSNNDLLPKKIVGEIKDCLLDFSNGWWRYFVTDGCEYMLSSDLQGCLDETIDTILKKYGGEDE